jgi:hypothetical protein
MGRENRTMKRGAARKRTKSLSSYALSQAQVRSALRIRESCGDT